MNKKIRIFYDSSERKFQFSWQKSNERPNRAQLTPTQLSTQIKGKKKKTEAEMNGYGGSSDSGNVNVDQNSIRPEPYVYILVTKKSSTLFTSH